MSNQLITKKKVKKALIGATLLAKSPLLWAQTGGNPAGGKNQLGVNQLSLEEVPGPNATVCASRESADTKTGSNQIPNDLSLAINPFNGFSTEVIFTVRDIIAQKKDHFLFLVYSPQLTPENSPEILTPLSKNKLRLVMANMEILAMYDIPAQEMLFQESTRLGQANPAGSSALSFKVNLDILNLPAFMANNDKAYLQAALISKENYQGGRLDTMILSELDTIEFVEIECPSENAYASMDSDGTLTVADYEGNVTKTTQTNSGNSGATLISGKIGGN
jgi:hypothetical protein